MKLIFVFLVAFIFQVNNMVEAQYQESVEKQSIPDSSQTKICNLIRKLVDLPAPKSATYDIGVVQINIWVNNKGVVVKAIPDALNTTSKDKYLAKACLKAAYKARFEENRKDTLESGYIRYKFE
jgi:hypothetical protein